MVRGDERAWYDAGWRASERESERWCGAEREVTVQWQAEGCE